MQHTLISFILILGVLANIPLYSAQTYPIVDTGQTVCYDTIIAISEPLPGQAFFGQDAQYNGNQPSYTLSTNGKTVHDNITGLTWQRSPDANNDGIINISDRYIWTQATARPAILNTANFGGYNDWRLPTIKELYSLIDFRGTDPSLTSDTATLTPFINTNYFQFAYGDTAAGARIIDSQYASSSLYAGQPNPMLGIKPFGVNFADGRIKGYGSTTLFLVQCVRGNTSYGINFFIDNSDQTITDKATDLMWAKSDSGIGMDWKSALAWVTTKNTQHYLGYTDWRLPNAKELQSIVDYTRAPDTTGSAAINPIFAYSTITNENSQIDFPWYWTGTTHQRFNGSGSAGAYVCFGRALGYMNSNWIDIHGAGAQRSDPKGGSLSGYTYVPNGYYNPLAPQGDAVRMYDYVRLVRDAHTTAASNWKEYQ
jgi:hypothetical protein